MQASVLCKDKFNRADPGNCHEPRAVIDSPSSSRIPAVLSHFTRESERTSYADISPSVKTVCTETSVYLLKGLVGSL
jgi:hypothetical protein